jgi:carbohydrate kinase (thermoresistant glucokinase family)
VHTVIYIIGVSGAGKTTIGQLLAKKMKIPFFDGDDFHPKINIEKMKASIPLTDDDRTDWLLTLNKLAYEQTQISNVIIACSALKEQYRQILNKGLSNVISIFLQGSYQTIYQRILQRTQHFMPASLIQSQFDILEIPKADLVVDIEKSPSDILELILNYLRTRNMAQ